MNRILALALGAMLACLSACTADPSGIDTTTGKLPDEGLPGNLTSEAGPALQGIPPDSLQPWESLTADGFVDPATARMSSAINQNSEFWRGVDAFEISGDASPSGQALALASGNAGSALRSSATYRIPLAGENPATLSTDINLRLRSDNTASGFYIGIANYGTGRWDFFGGFSDGRIRLPLAQGSAGDYISPLGNAFISIVAFNGSNFDIVGVSLNQFDPGDAFAPPVPGGLTLSPVAGGLELQWNSVVAADLAGYRIYWSKQSFVNPQSAGVKALPCLEGSTRHLLSGMSGPVFVAVSAVDLNGNESRVSILQSAAASAGSGPVLEMTADSASGITGSPIQLSASGAASYDWDLDGDGIYEVTADSSGSQFADTGKAGIIRPGVRASSSGGTAVALGAVSLIIAHDLPPVAILTANRTSGAISDGEASPFSVNLDASGSYDDGNELEYAWSTQGDGNWTAFDPADVTSGQYSRSGIYNAAVRVRDSANQEALALLPVSVQQVTGFVERKVFNGTAGLFGAMAIVAGRPAVVFRRFGPPDQDGLYYSRALDSQGRAWGAAVAISISPDIGDLCDIAVINGNPAIVFYKPIGKSINYIRAGNSTGQTALNWSNAPVKLEGPLDGPTGTNESPHLEYVSGNPALIWYDSGNVWYKRATSLAGTGDNSGDWGDAAFKIVASGSADFNPDLAMINGRPAIAYRDSSTNKAIFLRSTSSSGASALDWPASGVEVCGPDACNGRVNLAEVNGAPAVSYFEAGNSSLRYVRATSPDGILVADWPLAVEIYDYSNPGKVWHDLAVVNGRPALAFEDHTFGAGTTYVRANNANGSSWGVMQYVAPANNVSDSAYERIDLEDLNGFPAIFLQNATQNRAVVCTLDTDL